MHRLSFIVALAIQYLALTYRGNLQVTAHLSFRNVHLFLDQNAKMICFKEKKTNELFDTGETVAVGTGTIGLLFPV